MELSLELDDVLRLLIVENRGVREALSLRSGTFSRGNKGRWRALVTSCHLMDQGSHLLLEVLQLSLHVEAAVTLLGESGLGIDLGIIGVGGIGRTLAVIVLGFRGLGGGALRRHLGGVCGSRLRLRTRLG